MNRPSHLSPFTIALSALALLTFASPAMAARTCQPTQSETVQSDRSHYALGQTAQISGSGFAPSCSIKIRVTRPDLVQTTSGAITTDSSGRFTYSYAVNGPAGRFYNFDAIGRDQIAGGLFSAGAVVWTEKGDYHPGETVRIRGLGWKPGETVSLDLHENNGSRPDLEFAATADSAGAIFNTDFTPQPHHLDINFTLTATGLQSGRTAFNYFNDAGAFVKVIGTNTQSVANHSSITVTVPASGVAAGNSIIVSLSVGSFAGTINCSDPANGTYNVDLTSPDSGVARVAIVSAHDVSALSSGDVITCTFPTFSGISLVTALEFSGLSAAALDTSAANASTNSGTASSGLTAVTSQADELVFGLVRVGVGPAQTFTTATSGGNPVENPYNPPYTSAGAVTHGGNTVEIEPFYRFVSSTGQYEMNGTVTGSGGWRIGVVTYKVAPNGCTPTAADDTTCDGIDDDCSGGADEDYEPETNECGIGACEATGTASSCTGGVETPAGTCTPGSETGVSESICNGIDDDCDSSTDEDYEVVTNECGTGACAATGTPSSCIAGDETAAGSCTPGSPTGVSESICNGIDDDCDSSTDEDYEPITNTCGEGACASSGTPSSCVAGDETPAGPCTPGIPGAEPESVCNGLDDDCSGQADEDYEPVTNECGTGACAATGTPSSCSAGVETPAGECTPGSQTGVSESICNGIDDDCDSSTDEDYEVVTNECGTGACAASGTPSSCIAGDETPAGACTPGSQTGVSESICNGIDDDCDSSTDEDYEPITNTCGEGECASSGTPSTCVDGNETPAGECTPGIPGAEPESVCNGLDDDCSGQADEDYEPVTNDCGTGECAASGTPSSCSGGVETPAGPCTPGSPTSEVCDGADNDCDESTDENATDDGPLTQSCYTGPEGTEGVGVCEAGTETCVAGEFGECEGEVVPSSEICSNGIDENCNGSDSSSGDEAAIVTPSEPQYVLVSSLADVTFCAVLEDAEDGGPLDDITAVTTVHVLAKGVGSGFTAFDGNVATYEDSGDWVACVTFDRPPTDVYEITFTVLGCDYTGAGTTLLLVYDPAAGFTTGGGRLDYGDGTTAIFGFTAKYQKNGKVQGSLMYVERDSEGIENRLKSNAMLGLSIISSPTAPWVAVINGKATLNGVGNHTFVATVKDWGEPGTSDQFGIVAKNPASAIVINRPVTTISGGNIQVPHKRGK